MSRIVNTIKYKKPEFQAYRNEDLGLISFTIDGNNWTTMADKNVGATTVRNEGDSFTAANCGSMFQAGNNYQFPFSGCTNCTTTTRYKIDDIWTEPSAFSGDKFVTNTYVYDDTDDDKIRDLRGDVTDTLEARRGPCPEGFHVPTLKDVELILEYDYSTAKCKIPDDVKLAYSSGLRQQASVGFTWLSSTTKYTYTGRQYYYLNTKNGSVALDRYAPGRGIHVRPFKNVPVVPDSTRTKL